MLLLEFKDSFVTDYKKIINRYDMYIVYNIYSLFTTIDTFDF